MQELINRDRIEKTGVSKTGGFALDQTKETATGKFGWEAITCQVQGRGCWELCKPGETPELAGGVCNEAQLSKGPLLAQGEAKKGEKFELSFFSNSTFQYHG